jgi:TolA-binding protein
MKHLVILLITGLLALCLGCGTQEEPKKKVTAEEVKKKATEAVKTVMDYTAQEQEKYLQQARERLDTLDKRISDLRQQAANQTGELQQKLTEQVDGLEKQADAVKEKLAAMKDVSGDAWKKLKSGVDGSMTELEKAYKEASSQNK